MTPPRDEPSRDDTQERVSAWFDLGLSVLALVMLALLVVELGGLVEGAWRDRVVLAGTVIWAIFVIAFVIELWLAPNKSRYLRRNWPVVLSLAIPFLRVFRVARAFRLLRASRAVRAANLGRVAGTLNRARGAIRDFASASQFAYVVLLTLAVTLVAAGAAAYFESGRDDSAIRSFGDATWWAATLVTTVNSSDEPVSAEGRVLSLLVRAYGMAVFGYITARLAVFFLGRHPSADPRGDRAHSPPATERELLALREEIRSLREEIRESHGHEAGRGAEREATVTPPR